MLFFQWRSSSCFSTWFRTSFNLVVRQFIHVIVTLSILFLFLRFFFWFMILTLVILNLFYLIFYHAHKDITQACTFYVIKFTPYYDNNTMYLTPNLVNYLFSMNSYNYCFQMKRNRPVYVLYNSPLLWQLTFKAIIWLRLAVIVCYLSDISSIQTSCLLDQGK